MPAASPALPVAVGHVLSWRRWQVIAPTAALYLIPMQVDASAVLASTAPHGGFVPQYVSHAVILAASASSSVSFYFNPYNPAVPVPPEVSYSAPKPSAIS